MATPWFGVSSLEFVFEDCRVDAARKMLWRGPEFVPLGDRAYAILLALLESPGVTVSKRELFERAWSNLSVDEANLRVQIANLRKKLGAAGKNIISEQSLGYSYSGAVRRIEGLEATPAQKHFSVRPSLSRPVGREPVIASIEQALNDHRLITIVGPGGIGKTTLALEIASQIDGGFLDGACLADLSQASGPADVAAAVATALERPVLGEPLADVLVFLKMRRMLLVLDCCERVIDDAAELADTVLANAPGVSIVATSREALRVAGEFVENLDGLELAPEGPITAFVAAQYGSIALFARTAKAMSSAFELTDDNAPIVADVCRRLDGMPLAIDLAAGLSSALGLEQIRDGMDERVSVLTLGRRGGLPRHRTLDAVIAWSYDSLEEIEALVLRRLSVFAAWFTLADALAVIAFDELSQGAATLAIVSLSRKSLLNVDLSAQLPEYRLLETTRHFANARLDKDERARAADTFAHHVLARLVETDWDSMDVAAGRRLALGLAKDVREALSWAYDTGADVSLPIRLTIAAERAWVEISLFLEQQTRMHQAHAWLIKHEIKDLELRAAILTGVAAGTMYDAKRTPFEAVNDAIAATRAAGDRARLSRALIYGHFFYESRHDGRGLLIAEQLVAEAALDDAYYARSFAEVLLAVSKTHRNEWEIARALFKGVIDRTARDVPRSIAIYYGSEILPFALAGIAFIDGLQGFTRESYAHVDKALALTFDRGLPQGRFLILSRAACFLSFVSNDWDRARAYLDMLEQPARDFAPWAFMASAFRGWIAFSEGRVAEASELLERYCGVNIPSGTMFSAFQIALAEVRLTLGDADGAAAAAQKVFDRRIVEADVQVVGPALRVRADALAASGFEARLDEATALYRQAIENARLNAALVFEIPAALGLARLLARRGDREVACEILEATISRAPEAPGPVRMEEVKGLLRDLRRPTRTVEAPRA
ncbi:transcriptional regulator [Sphingobium sp. AP50]|uniref:ATP-binding protein n=1 Tax=Sphingobium sp. AP50 TaxID=1884369 RepID=UPI0008C90EDB|nr:winged helix-turn-helix domain-containing protein [Sphingobium sp. AP50]SEJ80420.1 transcriptional regulator [Sphingobium sp. AP50]